MVIEEFKGKKLEEIFDDKNNKTKEIILSNGDDTKTIFKSQKKMIEMKIKQINIHFLITHK